MLTHPKLFAVYNIWDSILSFHRFLHSPEYASPFLENIFPILDGAVQISTTEIKDMDTLKITIDSPVHQLSSLHIAMDKAATYLKWWNENREKHLGGEKMKAIWTAYSYEDPYVP